MNTHTPRCRCCRELAAIKAARSRGGRQTGGHNRKPCSACGSTAPGPRKRRMRGGKWVFFCEACEASANPTPISR